MTVLSHYPLCPFSRKVRLTLSEKRLETDLQLEKFWEKSPDHLARNLVGKVPVLKIDGLVLSESNAICEYLEEVYPTPALMPGDPRERAEVRRLVGMFDDSFYHEVTVKILGERVMKKITGAGQPDSRNVKDGMGRIKFYLDEMTRLLDHRRWLAGDVMTFADFAAAAQLSVLDYTSDVDWNRSAVLKDWYAKIKSRPAYRPLLRDMVGGFPPPLHYSDLDF
jgi:glutathione S-transferase